MIDWRTVFTATAGNGINVYGDIRTLGITGSMLYRGDPCIEGG